MLSKLFFGMRFPGNRIYDNLEVQGDWFLLSEPYSNNVVRIDNAL